MAEQAGPPRPDVTDMYAVHGVFRDTFAAVPALVGGVAAGDAARVEVVANYYDNVLFFLEAHHDGEDAIVYPLLRDRCTAEGNAALFDQMDAQHEEALQLLKEVRAAIGAWHAGDAATQRAALERLGALNDQLVRHLDAEETNVLPLAAVNLSAEEWGQLPGHAMANFGGDKIWLILGLIRQRMTEAQKTQMLAHMPPPAVEMWTGFGEQAFNDLTGDVVVEVRNRAPG